MTKRSFFGLAGLLTSLALAGCGGSSAGPSKAGSEGTSGGETASFEGPVASTDSARGEEQFEVLCGTCHPDGEEDIGPGLLAKRFPPAYVRQMVREGSGRMRPIPDNRLSADDLEAVLAYMITLDAIEADAALAAE